jgi:hypothetical protein
MNMSLLRRFVLLAAALLLTAGSFDGGAAPAQAGGSWSAWVYENGTGKLVHVFPDGAPPVEMMFPLPPGTSQPPSMLTISRDGAYLAACLYDDANNPSVRVYDIYNGVYLAAYIPTGPIAGCSLSRYSFSEDGTQVAFGILNHYAGTVDGRPDWELTVMQVNTSAILYRIDSNSPLITGLGVDYSGHLPFVSTFQMASGSFPGLISFRPVRWGTEGACEYDSIVWNLGQNTISTGGQYGKNGLDFLLPYSEAVWVETNPAYPVGTLMGPGCEHNVVMYSNKAGDNYPIFTNGTILYGSTMVDDGRRLAIGTSTNDVIQWMSLDRNGAVTSLLDVQRDVWGTPDGYVFFREGPFGVSELWQHRFTGGPTPEMIFLWNGIQGEYWSVIWVNPLTGPSGSLNPFPPIAAPSLPPAPTAPPVTGSLRVGGQARVNTTEGDLLRVRTGQGTDYPIAFQVPPGTIVTLLEGPVFGTGFNWWRIDAPGRGTGWAIEGVQEATGWLQTLIPVP